MATRIVIIGGGPAGYEAALVAAGRGPDVAHVTVVDSDGIGGACVLWDCVPSKTFIASTGVRTELRRADGLGFDIKIEDAQDLAAADPQPREDARAVAVGRHRLQSAARRASRSCTAAASSSTTCPAWPTTGCKVTTSDGKVGVLKADVVLIATGARPRVLPSAVPDGERILNWRQLYDLTELPEHLVIVGSGVTGAEFCNAYTELGVQVTVVASRDQILPHEDSDAAAVLEEAFAERGVKLVKNARAESVTRTADGVVVAMADGRTVEGSHALMTVGSVPNTEGLGLERVGIELGRGQLPFGRPGFAHHRVGHLRGRGLHRAAAAGVRGRHAGPHRDVPRARRGRVADPAAHRRRGRVHPPGDRRGRRAADRDRRRHRACPHADAAADHERQGEDVAAAPWLRQDLLPPGDRRRHRRRRRRADRLGADPADRAGRAEPDLR